jgi:hypothetical protein
LATTQAVTAEGPRLFTDGGYNISDDGTCGFGSITGANGQTLGDSVNPLLNLKLPPRGSKVRFARIELLNDVWGGDVLRVVDN